MVELHFTCGNVRKPSGSWLCGSLSGTSARSSARPRRSYNSASLKWTRESPGRRFYRHKYNAAKVLSAFSATLREEVDLATLSEQLVTVVEETMQPAHVSLWVRKPGRAEVPSLQVGQPLYKVAEGREEIAGQSV